MLCATGREPSLSPLGLPLAGVEEDERGIVVGSRDETSVPHIFAVGDARPEVSTRWHYCMFPQPDTNMDLSVTENQTQTWVSL